MAKILSSVQFEDNFCQQKIKSKLSLCDELQQQLLAQTLKFKNAKQAKAFLRWATIQSNISKNCNRACNLQRELEPLKNLTPLTNQENNQNEADQLLAMWQTWQQLQEDSASNSISSASTSSTSSSRSSNASSTGGSTIEDELESIVSTSSNNEIVCRQCRRSFNNRRMPCLLICKQRFHWVCVPCADDITKYRKRRGVVYQEHCEFRDEDTIVVKTSTEDNESGDVAQEQLQIELASNSTDEEFVNKRCRTRETKHYECPFCDIICHLPKNGFDGLLKPSLEKFNEMTSNGSGSVIPETLFYVLEETLDLTVEMKEKVGKNDSDGDKANVGTGVASLAGGITALVGACLIPVTFGASTVLLIVGGSVSGAGSAGVITSMITSTVFRRKYQDNAKNHLLQAKRLSEIMVRLNYSISEEQAGAGTGRGFFQAGGAAGAGFFAFGRLSANIAAGILIPLQALALLLDIFTIARSGYNLVKGNKSEVYDALVDLETKIRSALDEANQTTRRNSNEELPQV